jgi:hypothetical protein
VGRTRYRRRRLVDHSGMILAHMYGGYLAPLMLVPSIPRRDRCSLT